MASSASRSRYRQEKINRSIAPEYQLRTVLYNKHSGIQYTNIP